MQWHTVDEEGAVLKKSIVCSDMRTAAAASLGLILIAREIFWGPTTYAMMGGIIICIVLTLLFLPALHVGIRSRSARHGLRARLRHTRGVTFIKTRSVWCPAREFGRQNESG